MTRLNPSRRQFLRAASAVGTVAGTATPFALNLATMSAAVAQVPGDYKALVCLFMLGGNDHGNTVLATDPDSWSSYTELRGSGSDPITLAPTGQFGGVRPIAPVTPQPGREFGLHPELEALQTMFNDGQLAIVPNVGPLIASMSKTDYEDRLVPVPAKLFSHNDQQSTWQAYAPEGARVGWGGRMGDLLSSMNAEQTFTCLGTGGNSVWLSGQSTLPYRVSSNGAIPIRGLADSSLFGSSIAPGIMQDILTDNNTGHLIESSYSQVVARSIDAQEAINGAILSNEALPDPPTGVNGTNRTAANLKTVARIIAGRSALGARRQVFFVGMGGFDTHSEQNSRHAQLMADLGAAISYFFGLLADPQVGATNNVTLFTASDFGRTMASNGDGTDHGWGSHHFVAGGAVRGGDIYGRFPIIGRDTPDDVGRGRLLPEISVDQYGATLARWFGVSESLLDDVFPNLVNFGSNRNLGFML